MRGARGSQRERERRGAGIRQTAAASLSALCLALGLGAGPVHAQETPPAAEASAGARLSTGYRALADRRLLARETGSLAELTRRLREAETALFSERADEAANVLYELVESPRFDDFDTTDEGLSAEFLLGSALVELGAHRSALTVLGRVIDRGPDDPYFGPAYRRLVDIALSGPELEPVLARLEALPVDMSRPELADAANELRYLRGRARFDHDDRANAELELAAVGMRSRFFANAQYLRGVLAVRQGELERAEGLFCRVAPAPSDHDTDREVDPRRTESRFRFYVDQRYFEVRDLTWLALGRIAHESRRSDDAFYYYFQVPADSARVAEALYEAAWSMFEGGDETTALDLLAQLEARFPGSPFVDEALLLRGYVHLRHCEFEEADRDFVGFREAFVALRDEVRAILASPTRRDAIATELLDLDRASNDDALRTRPERARLRTILRLLRVDPEFFRLDGQLRLLDAETARASSTASSLREMREALARPDAPVRAAPLLDQGAEERALLLHEIDVARQGLLALGEQLRAFGGDARRPALEGELHTMEARLAELERRARVAIAGSIASEPSAAEADVERFLREERQAALDALPRAARLRAALVEQANRLTAEALTGLDARLSRNLRRAAIGRIDAVMGSKRRIELQIERLAAGEFPDELFDPLRVQGLLHDDEEYWPFDGELWPDEFEEDDEDDELSPDDTARDDTARDDTARDDTAEAP